MFDEDEQKHTWEADSVVLVTGCRCNEALYRELKDDVGLETLRADGVSALYRIGDCVAPRSLVRA